MIWFFFSVIAVLIVLNLFKVRKDKKTKTVRTVAGAVCIIAALAFSVWSDSELRNTVPPPPPPPVKTFAPTEIYLECVMDILPIQIPAKSTVEIVFLNENRMRGEDSGFSETVNTSDKVMSWPDSKTLKPRTHNPGANMYRCMVSNHGPTNVIDVGIQFQVVFRDGKNPLHWNVFATPLDSGREFTFYFVNSCPYPAAVLIPQSATIEVLGEDKRRNVPLRRPHKYYSESLMGFFPSKMNLGGTPCLTNVK
jgi:hypothetical protein